MSLISARNLLAPLQNKVHLMAIILIASAFLVLRLSGGSVAVHDKNKPVRARENVEEKTAEIDNMFDPRKEAERLGLAPAVERKVPDSVAVAPRENDYISNTLKKGDRKRAAERPGDSLESGQASRKGANSLDEIEQSLGLK